VFRDILAEGDENGDGEIDFDEFKNMMKKIIQGPIADKADKSKE
jgi:Ca2+-binding EF-hand superfamily protein